MHLSCRDLLEELSSYVDDEVAAELRERIEAHLATCRTCTVLVDTTRKTVRIVTESGSFTVPDGVSDRLAASVMKELRRTAGRRSPEPGSD